MSEPRKSDRVLIGVPSNLGSILRQRARAGYRSVSKEAEMLIERGLAAETASAPSA